ncbi:MAG: sensor histidine kinase [Xanthobacteraceae bacterium]
MRIRSEPQIVPRYESVPCATSYEKPTDCLRINCSAIAMYERELKMRKAVEVKLRKSVIRERALLRQQARLIAQKETLSEESEHRLLNGLQLIASLLGIQSHATSNAETAAQLAVAADRVAAIGRVHRHLHKLDHVESVEFKQYLQSLCHDLAEMVSNDDQKRALVVDGIELRIPTRKGIPLGFIASKLITNSIKYAKGRIAVRLEKRDGKGYALSISDDGPGLPETFDPSKSRGLGMKLVASLVGQIHGQLQIARGENGQGTQFTVLFP